MTIWLQPEDELNTIIHRIQATSDAEVTLVVPGEGGVLRDPVAWGLLPSTRSALANRSWWTPRIRWCVSWFSKQA